MTLFMDNTLLLSTFLLIAACNSFSCLIFNSC
jgi:hypothetical protein